MCVRKRYVCCWSLNLREIEIYRCSIFRRMLLKTENGYQGAKQLRTYFNYWFQESTLSKAKRSAEKSAQFRNNLCETEKNGYLQMEASPIHFPKTISRSIGVTLCAPCVWFCSTESSNHRLIFVVVNKECSKWKGKEAKTKIEKNFTAFILMRKRSVFIFHTIWISGIYWCISKS